MSAQRIWLWSSLKWMHLEEVVHPTKDQAEATRLANVLGLEEHMAVQEATAVSKMTTMKNISKSAKIIMASRMLRLTIVHITRAVEEHLELRRLIQAVMVEELFD